MITRNAMRLILFVVVATGGLSLSSNSWAQQSVRIVSVNGVSVPTADLYTLDQHLVSEWEATDGTGCGGVADGELFVWIDGFYVQTVDPEDPEENDGDRLHGVFTVDPDKIPDPDRPSYNDPDKFFHFGCLHAIKLVANMEFATDEEHPCGSTHDVNSTLAPFWTTLKRDCDGGSTSCGGGEEFVGQSVDVATGVVHHDVTDFVIPGPLPIEFTRRYDSNSTYNGALGYGWQHSYEIRLERSEQLLPGVPDPIFSRKITFIDGNGHRSFFTKDQQASPTSWHGDASETLKLEGADGSTWLVTDKDGMKYTFYAFSTSEEIRVAKLKSIDDRNGNTLTFGYTGGRLTSISDEIGHVVTLAYDGNYISNISIGDTTVSSYYVDPIGDLRSATNGRTETSYHYFQDPEQSGPLSSLQHKLVTVSHGEDPAIIVESHEYDPDTKRVTRTEAGGGRNAYRISYNSPTQTTVTNNATVPVPTVYTIDPFTGYVTDRTDGPGCGSCGGAGIATQKQFDSHRNLKWVADARGVVTEMTYDERGNVLTRTEAVETALSRTTTYTYMDLDADLRLLETISVPTVGTGVCAAANPNKIVTLRYYPTGKLKSTKTTGCNGSEAFEHITAYTYDGRGQLESIDGPRDNENDANDVTSYSYYADYFHEGEGEIDVNKRGRLHTITKLLDQVTTFNEYDDLGHPLSVTDPNGVETRYTYNSVLRDLVHKVIVGANSDDPATTEYDYYFSGNVNLVWDPECYATWYDEDDDFYCDYSVWYEYDDGGELHAIHDYFGNKIVYSYDQVTGNRIREEFEDPNEATTRFTNFDYDAFRRLEYKFFSTDAPEGAGSVYYKYTYYPDGTLETERDPEGHITTSYYDELKRLTSVVQTVGSENLTTTYEYDTQDNLIKVIDPRELETTYTYGDTGWRLSATSPDTGTTTYKYDPSGNLTETTDANGVIVTRAYDALNRLTKIIYPDSSLDVTYEYDSTEKPFGIGRRTKMIDATGAATFSYDQRGNLTSEEKKIDGLTFVTVYDYDRNGNVTEVRYPSTDPTTRQGAVSYHYDWADRIDGVSILVAGEPVDIASDFQYKPFGPRTATTLGNGLTDTRSFDTRYQADTWALTDPNFGDRLHYTHDFDNDGNLTTLTDGLEPLLNSRTFGYDEVHRLTHVTGPWSDTTECADGGQTYTYDKNGNRLCKGEFGAITSYGYSSISNRLESSTTGIVPLIYGYDDRGNITSINAQTFGYSDANRLASVDAGATAYLYDGDGRRVTKTNPQTAYYFYDPSGRLLTEMVLGQAPGDGTAEGHDFIHLPEGPLARIDWLVVPNPEYLPECSPTKDLCPPPRIAMMDVLYHHNDHLGTPIALTNKTGEMALHTEYLPFGEVFENTIASVENNLRFPGQYFDEETGLHQNWFRDYDPKTGRYRESDPIGLFGGLNTYGYVGQDPLNNIDPSGRGPVYGFWCGPDWTGGYPKSWDKMTPIEQKAAIPPIDKLDVACKVHDLCYADCRTRYACEADMRSNCFRVCDYALTKAAYEVGGYNGRKIGAAIDRPGNRDPGANSDSCCSGAKQ